MRLFLSHYISNGKPLDFMARDRYLVTTAIECTWPHKDIPIIFLGDWCKIYTRQSKWSEYDSLVVPYHWDDRKNLFADYVYLRNLHEVLLNELCIALNALHKVNYSLRYWRILIGPWLGYFVQMIFDRYEMMKLALTNYDISGVSIVGGDLDRFVPNDMKEFHAMYYCDPWNQYIFEYLFNNLNVGKSIRTNKLGTQSYLESDAPIEGYSLKESLVKLAALLSGMMVSSTESFRISDYMPKVYSLGFDISELKIPKMWRTLDCGKFWYSSELREKLSLRSLGIGFDLLIRELIPIHIPRIYMEGYRNISDLIPNLPWPKKPKYILTRNAHNGDDVFKFWAAEKVEIGTPLIIGQHGGHYGVGKWSFMEEHEIAISDRYLTWGWQDKTSDKVYRSFVTNSLNKPRRSTDSVGYLLLVCAVLPRYSYWMYSIPVSSQLSHYFSDQFKFVSALSTTVFQNLLVRLSKLEKFGWCQSERWKDRFPNINLDPGISRMQVLRKKCRLFVSTYNATTYLESLSENIPTVIFWDPQYWELRESSVKHFNILAEAGILHYSPESAAEKVNAIWSNIDKWWTQPKIQSARREFCDIYARHSEKPLAQLKSDCNLRPDAGGGLTQLMSR
jgi:putative transferase (TIGR04331 family)